MPFTFSHPAIVLPLAYLPKKWYSLTGLVIGSMTPDFEYFLRMKIQGNYGHSISGIFLFDLPLGLFLAFLYHNIVRDSLIENLPTYLTSRLSYGCRFNWNKHFKTHWMVVIFSVLVGVISHLFWDSFTHYNGYFVSSIPLLQNNIEILNRQIPVYKILQHSSTLLGGLIIVIVLSKLPSNKQVIGHFNWNYWSILSAITLMIVITRLYMGLDYKLSGQIIVTTISAGMIGLIVTPLIIKRKDT
jgi:hypothetical protein